MKSITDLVPVILREEWQVNPTVLQDLETAPPSPVKRRKRSIKEKWEFGERFSSQLPKAVTNSKGESF